MDKFPRAYVNDVPKSSDQSLMKTVDFDRMGIGARNSGMPKQPGSGAKLTHIGTDASKGGKGAGSRA